MQTKYKRLTSTAPRNSEVSCLVPEQTRPAALLEGTRWGEETYVAARELRDAAAKDSGWMPFSAPGLSVGPSLIRNHLRVDLYDQRGEARSLLVSSAELARWLAVVQ